MLTLQSFTPSAIETEITIYLQSVYDTDIENQRINKMINTCDAVREQSSEFSYITGDSRNRILQECNDLELQRLVSESKLEALHEWGIAQGYVDREFYQTSYVDEKHLETVQCLAALPILS